MPQSASLIDLDTLPADVRWRVECALREATATSERDQRMRDACQNASDQDLIAMAEKEYPGAPIGLSTWYPSVWPRQETIFNRVAYNEMRRPVFMRGSRGVRIRTFGLSKFSDNPNGWAIAVYRRAMRMSRKTFMEYEEYEEFSSYLCQKIIKRYPSVTSVFDDYVTIWKSHWNSAKEPIRIIGGRLAMLTPDQFRHIEILHSIIRRSEHLDKQARRALVRQSMMERLAA